jgi:hypothetical protein
MHPEQGDQERGVDQNRGHHADERLAAKGLACLRDHPSRV